jgi:hypothetical protein
MSRARVHSVLSSLRRNRFGAAYSKADYLFTESVGLFPSAPRIFAQIEVQPERIGCPNIVNCGAEYKRCVCGLLPE